MATLADVAALAGVSKATASRTLSRPEVVSPDTAARVLTAAAKLGFTPNSAARQLARGRTGVVALVVPTLDNAFFTPIIGGAQRRADEDGLQLTVAVHPLEAVRELTAFERLSRQVDGFIVVAPRGSDDLLLSAGAHKPTVLVD
ncbi:MAG: LacI family transcriptional regulator, partial [Actinobacteria bacterium]|nr:LacI family transcriptional regulator [Actinomycetota bacterium]